MPGHERVLAVSSPHAAQQHGEESDRVRAGGPYGVVPEGQGRAESVSVQDVHATVHSVSEAGEEREGGRDVRQDERGGAAERHLVLQLLLVARPELAVGCGHR